MKGILCFCKGCGHKVEVEIEYICYVGKPIINYYCERHGSAVMTTLKRFGLKCSSKVINEKEKVIFT